MRSGGWRQRMAAAASATALLTWGLAEPALADSPVAIAASGPASITTSTDSSTGRVVATFVVTDSSRTATGATICRGYEDTKGQGCRYQRFDGQPVGDGYDDYYDDYDDDYDDEYTRWDVVGTPGAWTVSYPIGFDAITREECLAATWRDAPFSATMSVMNDAGVVLATTEWVYQVRCTGIEGASAGPERTRVYAGRSTKSKPFTFVVLDTEHLLKSYRICRYDSVSGRYAGCDREVLRARNRTDDGWVVSYHLTWGPMGSSACAFVGRKWPQAGFRVQYYDRGLDRRLTLFWGTRLDC